MTEESRFDKTRRTFMKGAAATGIAATGIAAFSGNAAAQPNIDTSDFTVIEQDGVQTAEGLIVVQAQNIAITDLVEVVIGRSVVENVEILNITDNVVQIAITESLVDVRGVQAQIAVTVLGQSTQGQQQEIERTVRGRTRVDQRA
jgi:hypothetical protein